MKKLILFFILLIFNSLRVFSQSGYVELYQDIVAKNTNNLIETPEKGFLFLSTKDNSLYILNTDSLAHKNWDIELKYKNYSTEGISLAKINDTTFVGLGKSNENIFVVKFKTNGDTVWTKLYGDNQDNTPCSLLNTSDNSIIISGYSGSTYEQGFLLKLNEQGDSVFFRTNDWSTSDNRFHSLVESNNSFVVVGELDNDAFITKYSNTGDTVWTRRYGGSSTDVAYSIEKTDDNNFLVVGSYYIPGDLYTEIYLIKINQSGDTIWTKTFGGDYYDDIAYSINKTSDNKFIITGEHNSVFGGDFTNGFYSIINSDGDIISTEIYRLSENVVFYSAVLAKNYCYMILGKQSDNLLILRTNKNGGFYTSVKNLETSEIRMYPNPAENTIVIYTLFSTYKCVEIYNSSGQTTLSAEINSNTTELNVSSLKSGLYIVKLIGKEGVATSRLIIK